MLRATALQHRTATERDEARQAREASRSTRIATGATRRKARHELDRYEGHVDALRAWRTVPRGSSASDDRRTPAVDVGIWAEHVRYARSRHPAVRARLAEEYRGYAVSLARRLHRDGESLDDLIQVAMEALLLALDRFDPDRGIPFPAFATPTILGSLKRHYRDHGWSVRVPRRVHEIAVPARKASDRLTHVLGRTPTPAEVGVDVATLLAAQEATNARSVSSLDATLGAPERGSAALASDDTDILRAENRVALAQALQELTEREREILGLYFFDELSQSEIGRRYEVSQMQVSRWITAALRRLRDRMPED
jgi:RNA polymerase sigma-B factor